jgi:hypothetical protein
MLGYPASTPSQIVFLVGILLLIVGIVGTGYFQNPFLKNASQICAFARDACLLRRQNGDVLPSPQADHDKPQNRNGFPVLAITVLPSALFWA